MLRLDRSVVYEVVVVGRAAVVLVRREARRGSESCIVLVRRSGVEGVVGF